MPDNIENNTIYVNDGRKRICFEIEGIHYFANISIGELLMPMVEVHEDFDYRGYVSSQLVNAVDSQQRPTIEQVISPPHCPPEKIRNSNGSLMKFFPNWTQNCLVHVRIRRVRVSNRSKNVIHFGVLMYRKRKFLNGLF